MNNENENPQPQEETKPQPRTFLRGEDGVLREVEIVPDPLGTSLSEALESKLKTVKVVGSEKENDIFQGVMFTIPGDTKFIEVLPDTPNSKEEPSEEA